MSKYKSVVNVLVKLFVVLLVVALCAGAIGFIMHYTAGGTSDFKTFYVVYDGQEVLQNTKGMELKLGVETRVDCKYTFNFLYDDKNLGYTVDIVPRVSDDFEFDFTVDGDTYVYGAEKSLINAFDVKKFDDYFTIYMPGETTLQNVLSKNYPDKTVVAPDIIPEFDYFTFILKSYNGETVIKIDFHFVWVFGIEIDKVGIVF